MRIRSCVCAFVCFALCFLTACSPYSAGRPDFDAGETLTPEDVESIIAAVSEKEAETTVKYAPVTDESGGTVVFWTESGKVWHVSSECPSLKKSINIKSGDLTAAETAGKKKSCSVCGKGATK